jgi:hypothetical protein
MGGLSKAKAPKKAEKEKVDATDHDESHLFKRFQFCITNVVRPVNKKGGRLCHHLDERALP